MLDEKGFDLWADGYDKSVGLSDETGSYPFAGYKRVLNEIYNRVLSGPGRLQPARNWNGAGSKTATNGMRTKSILWQRSGRLIFRSFPLQPALIVRGCWN